MNIGQEEIAKIKRGLSWVELKESLSLAGCPVCSTMLRSLQRYFESLLYEFALDASVHKKTLASFGMCNTHTYMLKESEKKLNSDGLNIAVLYETLIKKEIKLIDKIKKKRLKNKKNHILQIIRNNAFANFKKEILNEMIFNGICPGCEHQKHSESFYSQEIIRLAGDKEFRDKYESVDVLLCRRHFLFIINEAENIEALNYFINEQRTKILRLQNQLNGFIRKHDYRLKNEMTDEESKAWEIILEYTGSKKSIHKEGYNNLLVE